MCAVEGKSFCGGGVSTSGEKQHKLALELSIKTLNSPILGIDKLANKEVPEEHSEQAVTHRWDLPSACQTLQSSRRMSSATHPSLAALVAQNNP